MRMYRRPVLVVGIVALLLALNSLACSIRGEVDVEGPLAATQASGEEPGAEETATPTPPPPVEPTTPSEAEAAEPTAVPETDETPEPVEEATTVPAAPPPGVEDPLEAADIPELEVFTLDPTGEGLGHLGTFRQQMTVSFTADATGYTGVYHYDAEVNTADQAVHVTVSAEGPAAQELPANQVQAIWIGTQLWIKLGNQPWLPVPESVAELQFDEQLIAVGDFLPYVQYFERVGEETVNGIPSAHYTYDAQDLPTESGTVSGHGDVYVALDGGYVVRYMLEGSGTFDGSFQGSGVINLVYDTYDVGAEIVIRPPRR